MIDEFDLWNNHKKKIHKNNKILYFHEREVWFCRLGKNIGFEQNGVGSKFLRPVVIIKVFNYQTFFAVPLTTRKKIGKFYFHLPQLNNKDNYAILSQFKVLDARRLTKKLCFVPKDQYENLIEKLIDIIKK